MKFAIGICGCFPLFALAAGPATQPVAPMDSSAADVSALPDGPSPVLRDGTINDASADDATPPSRRPDGPLGRGRLAQRFLPAVTDNEISQAMIYLQSHSPNRYTFIHNLPENSDRKSNLTEVATRSYQKWMQVAKEDPELYGLIVKRIGVEDKIFGLVGELRKEAPENLAGTQAELREQVGQLVDVGIKERQLRLDRLAKTVDEQQKKLSEDRVNRDNLIEDRLKNIMSEGKALFPDAGNGPRGRGGPRSAGDNH